MKKLLLIVGVSSVLVLGACKKEDSNAAGSGAASAKVDEKKSSACPATAWKEPGGLFCINAPGFTAGEIEKHADDPEDPEMRLYFKKAQGDGKPDVMFRLSWYPKRDNMGALGVAGSMESDYKNNKGEDKGEFAGGKGKFVVFARKDDAKSHQLYAVVQGNKHYLNCEGSNYEAPIAPEVVAACKSLTPTD